MWHQKPIVSILKELDTDAIAGLSSKEVKRRLVKYGPNCLPAKEKPPVILKFIAQFKNVLVVILLGATVVSFLLGDILDAFVIVIIVLINASIGFIQELQAEKTLEMLKQKDVYHAMVTRNGDVSTVAFENIVPGDILILEEGEKVPSDARVIESFSLRIDESILTGESAPASKITQELSEESVPLADRRNIIFKDTKVVMGRGKAVVVATGRMTEIGKIATFLEEGTTPPTPLTVELDKVGKMLTLAIGAIASVVFFINFLGRLPFVESLLISISLAVAAIPEGLPAVVTIVLSLGVKRLAVKNSIVKKLPAVETLGAVRIIATDKTGTLTQNKINVVTIVLSDGKEYTVVGEGYNPTGLFFDGKKNSIDPQTVAPLEFLLKAGILASNASINTRNNTIIGDTTEGALLVCGRRANQRINEIRENYLRLSEIPFSSERKMMSVLVKLEGSNDYFLFSKGAPEVIINKCRLDDLKRKEILTKTQKLAKNGLRNLCIAYKKLNRDEVANFTKKDVVEENNLTYVGLVGMQDPLRLEIKDALLQARLAGIRTVMITGDHKETARAIALQAGIFDENHTVLTENDLMKLTDGGLTDKIKDGVNVFARISPMGKLRIIEAIKRIPYMQVAVTGDGVNDAPALKASHIGIAMGQTGTDVAREMADMVLMDDNYATIVVAIEEGRVIFANLVKFIRYLISCNISEVLLIALGVFTGTPMPLLPIQILWINLITDGFPALALGVDPPEYDVMKKPPRDLSEGILHKKRWVYMMVEGSIMGIAAFTLFLYAIENFSYPVAQTMTFAAVSISQLVHAFNNRSTRRSLFQLGIFTNKFLVAAVSISMLLQFIIIQSYWGNLVFKTVQLGFVQWILIISVSLLPFFVVEFKKQLRFRFLP